MCWQSRFVPASNLYNTSDQNPLLRGFGINAALSADNPESVANFYSPLESPTGNYFSLSFQYLYYFHLYLIVFVCLGSDDEGDTSHARSLGSALTEASSRSASISKRALLFSLTHPNFVATRCSIECSVNTRGILYRVSSLWQHVWLAEAYSLHE